MIVSAIVAMSSNKIIGVNNDIPWYLPADLKYFKRTTLDHHIIMGRKCFDSIGKPLPKRTNIIMTRNPFFVVSGALVVHGIEEALTIAYDDKAEEVFIVGGAEIYKLAWKYLDKLYLTRVDTIIEPKEGDDVIYFPDFDEDKWSIASKVDKTATEKNPFNFSFEIYERIPVKSVN